MSAVMSADPAAVNAGVSTIVDSTRRMVFRCQAATNLFLLCLILVRGNRRIRKQLEDLRVVVSNLTIKDDGDRSALRQPARWLGTSAVQWETLQHKWVSEIVPRFPVRIPLINALGSLIGRQLEDLASRTEDLAETLALAASEPFAALVQEEIASNLAASTTRHETA